MGRSSTGECGAKGRAGKHDHSRQIVHIAKANGGTDDELDFVVGSLRTSIGESEAGSGNDGGKVALDFHTQVPEHRDSAPLGPGHPLGKGVGNFVRPGFEGQTQVLFESDSAVSGTLDTDLLEIVRDRLRCFQAGDFATRENACALTHIEEALMWMNKRVEDRIERNVLGTMQK